MEMSLKEEIAGVIDILKVAKKFQDSIEIDGVIILLEEILNNEKPKAPLSAVTEQESQWLKKPI